MMNIRFSFLALTILYSAIAFADCERYVKNTALCDFSVNLTACDEEAIRNYSEGSYLPLNKHLRGIELDEKCNEVSTKLNMALQKLPSTGKLTVFRGMKLINSLRTLKLDECFRDLGFSSASTRERVAMGFSGYNADSALLIIESYSGKDISRFSYAPSESEILLLPNTHLKLKKVDLNNQIETEFYFEEVKSDQCLVIKN